MRASLTDWLIRHSSGRLALAALAATVLFMLTVVPAGDAKVAVHAGTAGQPDTSLHYTAQDLYRMAGQLGAAGRSAYLASRLAGFDLCFPALYGAGLALALGWLARAFAPASAWRWIPLLPLAAALADYLENAAVALVMLRYPAPTPVIDQLAGGLTALKWALVGASLVAIVASGVFRLARGRSDP
ncbi:hypothetical protein G3580_16645 [Nitrogeniibacter mangrovi]|uniref:Uncharacterized protein n=1 Tax=Nitrogeniibacter mangrovi TaxID=2016596 RepID=A0A6C1B5Y4_9RHOO|nr:hypothetical protein [Nitrogeniibacter mangrovi]QID19101.1 hypothetical protein G3580_16645 [Nitrogeniibacter mangrovi]